MILLGSDVLQLVAIFIFPFSAPQVCVLVLPMQSMSTFRLAFLFYNHYFFLTVS